MREEGVIPQTGSRQELIINIVRFLHKGLSMPRCLSSAALTGRRYAHKRAANATVSVRCGTHRAEACCKQSTSANEHSANEHSANER